MKDFSTHSYGGRHEDGLSAAALFALSFLLLATLAGHDLAYGLAPTLPGAAQAGALAGTHAYLDVANALLPLVTIGAFALLLRLLTRRARAFAIALDVDILPRSVQAGIATALPAFVFAGMEITERIAAGVDVASALSFIAAGSLLQAAIGLVVLGVVRVGLRVTDALVRRLTHARTPWRTCNITLLALQESPLRVPPSNVLARNLAGRAPPVVLHTV